MMRCGLWTGMFYRHGFSLEKSLELLKSAGFECAELCECYAAGCFRNGAIPDSLPLPLSQCHSPHLQAEKSDGEIMKWFDLFAGMLEKADIHVCVLHPMEDHSRNLRLFPMLADCAANHSIRIGMENLIGRDSRLLAEYCDKNPLLGVNIDSAHACANGEKTEDLIRFFGNRVIGVHFSDSDGGPEDLHLIPGKGIVRWGEILSALNDAGYRGDFHLELPHERCAEWEDTYKNACEAAASAKKILGKDGKC